MSDDVTAALHGSVSRSDDPVIDPNHPLAKAQTFGDSITAVAPAEDSLAGAILRLRRASTEDSGMPTDDAWSSTTRR